jgi:hypothetical protein
MSPQYLLDGFSSSVDSLAGLSSVSVNGPPGQPEWGRPLLIALIALAIFGKWRKPGVSPYFWSATAAAVSYWLLAAFDFVPGREAASSRYVYAGAAFVLLMAASLLEGVKLSRRALWIGAGLTVLALGPNLAQMKDGADWEKEQTLFTRSDTAALEIARPTVAPSFALGAPEVAGTASLALVNAQQYFEAVDNHGSPAFSPQELAAAPENGQHWADLVLSQALPLSTATRPGAFLPNDPSRCLTLPGGEGEGTPAVKLEPGLTRIWLAPGPAAPLLLRRFTTREFPVDLGELPGGSTTLLRIPHDRAPRYPWRLRVESAQPVRFCH